MLLADGEASERGSQKTEVGASDAMVGGLRAVPWLRVGELIGPCRTK
jgi:hypothetical protein